MLSFHPKPGDILLCRFPECLKAPEMVKVRPVVVVSPRIAGRAALVCVVPLSTTEPEPIGDHHVELPIARMPRSLQAEARRVWAKCDMLYTFSLERLDRFKAGKDRSSGKRLYEVGRLELNELREVRRRAAVVLGFPLKTEADAPRL